MTREEAKGNLIHAIRWNDMPKKEALDIAIKALETLEEFEKAQIITGGRLNGRTYAYKCGLEDGKRKASEQELCDDATNREDALKAMIEQLGIRNEDYLIPAEATLYKVVKNMPPVTPQPKMGRWIESKGCNDIDNFYVCSECGRYIKLNCGAKLSDYPYCHCGAKMQESEG